MKQLFDIKLQEIVLDLFCYMFVYLEVSMGDLLLICFIHFNLFL